MTALTVGALALAGCGAATQPTSESTPSISTAPVVDSGATTEPTASPDAPTDAPGLPTEAAALDQAVTFANGVTVEVVSATATAVEAETPGEVSGPAVVVKIRAVNDSQEDVDLDSAVVMLAAVDGEVGIGTTAGDNSPLGGVIGRGQSVDATYTFMLGSPAGRTINVTVNYSAGQPVAEFTGEISS
ncbi:hypothetical protein ABC304_01775 [Microbacterium sp. 1P10UB]|uniref:hypothetical protein n=1 Tax=unclassified Microbacterium TaxID=2609290 RepID=UPI0039A170C9